MTWTDRKLKGCAQAGCGAPALEDHCLCARHRDDHRARNARVMRQARAFAEAQLGLPLSTSS